MRHPVVHDQSPRGLVQVGMVEVAEQNTVVDIGSSGRMIV
jgi:hypothetical protein